jgi:hypothetical protein
VKPANEGGRPLEELAEPREGAEGNTIGHGKRRTPSRESLSHGLDRVRQAAKDHKTERFTALLHHIDTELLRSAYGWLRKEASAGVDGVTWADYGEGLEDRLTDLHDRIHRGAYRAKLAKGSAGASRWKGQMRGNHHGECIYRSRMAASVP